MQTGRISELVAKAEEELKAVHHLVDIAAADWIIGFHCQQIAERLLKAVWISRGGNPPNTHDVVLLMEEVEGTGIVVPSWFSQLEDLNPFAVQLRYETPGTVIDFDAQEALALARRTYEWARVELHLTRGGVGDSL
jgi:HEPN domain-containing protein